MTRAASRKGIPGPRGLEPLRWLGAMRRDPLRGFLAAVHRYGDVVRFPLPPGRQHRELVIAAHPDDVQRVLQSNHTNYGRAHTYDVLKVLLGEGLLTARGDTWKRHRRLIQPGFHRDRIAGFAEIMVGTTVQMLERWDSRPSGTTIDVAREMQRLTLEIVGRTLFTSDLGQQAKTVERALGLALAYVRERTDSLVPLHYPRPSATYLEFRRAAGRLNRLVDTLVRERRPVADDYDDLLSMLLLARDAETGLTLDDRQVRDEIVTFMLAGHETTANALTWTWYLLSTHPRARAGVHEELDRVLGDGLPGYTDVPELAVTRATIDEGMRLYPPAWIVERAALGDDVLSGYRIRRGTIVVTSPWITHRHADVWRDPEAYVPERFAREAVAHRHRFAYFPFGGGPRTCIGRPFALLEAPLVLATIAQRYRLDVVPGFPVDPEPSVTLRPRHGVRMHAVRR